MSLLWDVFKLKVLSMRIWKAVKYFIKQIIVIKSWDKVIKISRFLLFENKYTYILNFLVWDWDEISMKIFIWILNLVRSNFPKLSMTVDKKVIKTTESEQLGSNGTTRSYFYQEHRTPTNDPIKRGRFTDLGESWYNR